MKKSYITICLIIILRSLLTAQQPSPTPPTVDDGPVKVSTDLIQLDVTVTDKNGRPVTDLTADDFELFENGERQSISNFSFISRGSGGAIIGSQIDPTAKEVNGIGREAAAPARPRVIAMVIDDLNLSFQSVFNTRKALLRFVDVQMQPGDLVAIIRTGGGVGVLQQFTSDKTILKSAIENLRWNPLGSAAIDDLMSVSQNNTELTERFSQESDIIATQAGGATEGRKTLIHENISDKKRTDYDVTKNSQEQENGIRTSTMLGTLKYVLDGMGKMPGRKMMMFFSDGLAIDNDSNKSRNSGLFTQLQEVAETANRSSVVIYTFDSRGMRSMALQASDSTYEVIDGHREQKFRERRDIFKASQEGLNYFAQQTGGEAILNTSDLNGGIARSLDEQSSYYLLAYTPNVEFFDASKHKFNKFEVKVKRPGLRVSYRSGLFSDGGRKAPADLSAGSQLANALMSPFTASEVAVALNALYANDDVDGSYIRSFIHIDASDLAFHDTADGWKEAAFDIAAVTFGDNGVAVDQMQTKYTIRAKGPTFAMMMDKGFIYLLVMPIKTPGTFQFRVALRDTSSGRIGVASQTVEIPDLRKRGFTLSSLAVENLDLRTWQDLASGKIGSGSDMIKARSTLLYDTALRKFRKGTVLRYGLEAYNSRSGAKDSKLSFQAKILQGANVIVQGNVNK